MTGIEAVVPGDSYEQAARTALDSVTTEQPIGYRRLRRGNRKLSTLVSYDQREPVVLQLCDERSWLRTESALLREIRSQTEVPVPPVLASGTQAEIGYMVTDHADGRDLHERFASLEGERKARLAHGFGSHLASLHEQFRFEDYGALVVDGESFQAWHEDWADWFSEYGRSAVERLPAEFDSLRAKLLELFATYSPDETPTARLYPWDFRPGNALIKDGQVTAILDWEAPMAAGPALSVAKAEYLIADWYVDEPAPLRRAFVDGYEQVREYPTVEPVHRAAAIADSAVDSTGTVTNPKYPELSERSAIEFHRTALGRLL